MKKENTLKTGVPLRFKTILCDAPWAIDFIKLKMRPNQVKMPYPTMMTKQIMALPVKEIADKDCNLFLWTTHTYLPDALEVAKAWGFKYHALLVWEKNTGRPCCGFKRDTEFVIYAYKGRITVKQRGEYIHTIFKEAVEAHSRKPDIFYSILEKNTPEPRIELFSRARRSGWYCVGNAIDGKDIKDALREGNFIYEENRKMRV
jgi:N6-adenosine-specific RNA methylase IME4